ncbi:MAG: peroxiredoxin family protein [Candidatus Promineifilaceae bacterium]
MDNSMEKDSGEDMADTMAEEMDDDGDDSAMDSDLDNDDENMAGDSDHEDENMDDESEHEDDTMAGSDDGGMEESAENAEESEDMTSAVDGPAWWTLPLTNARTGETFALADFQGKTVYVEPMATWCGNCRSQLRNVREAKDQLADENVIFVALSVETNISAGELANYADNEGFDSDWTFAVLSPELLREIAAEFGQSITNPPSTPHFLIRADGTPTGLVTGIDSAGDIINQITAAQG